MSETFLKSRLVAAVAISALVATAGCSSGSATSGTRSSGTSGADATSRSAVVAKAKSTYDAYTKPQAPIALPLLPSKPSADKSITIVTCPFPVCIKFSDSVADGSSKLGWKVTTLSSQVTPESYISTLNHIVANPPDLLAIVAAVFPNSLIAQQLKALQSAGTKIVEVNPAGDEPSAAGPVQGATVGPKDLARMGELMGAAVVADANGPAKTVFVTDPSLALSFQGEQDGFSGTVKQAGGSADELKVSLANVGKAIPSQVVSYVQSHPDVKYVAFAFADLIVGVPGALKSAGLSDKVKIISRAAQASDLAAVAKGDEWAVIGEENVGGGYRDVDLLARLSEGVALGDLADAIAWARIYVRSNVPSQEVTPGYPEAYLRAWHLSS